MKKCVNGQYIEMTEEEIAAMQPTPLSLKERQDLLRVQRKEEFNKYYDRGPGFFHDLTPEQNDEIEAWRKAWCDVTDTFVIPERPKWLKEL